MNRIAREILIGAGAGIMITFLFIGATVIVFSLLAMFGIVESAL